LDAGVSLETVEVALNLNHDRIGDLTVTLTSPSGTVSTLMAQPGAGLLGGGTLDFTFTSNEFMGESSQGTWTLTVSDATPFFVGTLSSWEITAYGSPDTSDDTYVFTDEFGSNVGDDASRQLLTDTAGSDALNASAVTSDLALNLNPGETSTVSGASFTIGAGSVIEDAYGGDGNDVIRGNEVANRLQGGWGDDTFLLGGGADTVDGGFGRDVVQAQTGGGPVTVSVDADGKATIPLVSGTVTATDVELIVLDSQTIMTNRPGASFDAEFYLESNRDIAAFFTEETALDHFQAFGRQEGRDPNALFDTRYYLAENADVNAAVATGAITAYDHFTVFGWQEGRDPSGYFDTSGYRDTHVDVVAAAVNPLDHYLLFGAAEGRIVSLADASFPM